MHRIVNIAGNDNNDDILIQQPRADCLFITSVKADINIISDILSKKKESCLYDNLRALYISSLDTPAKIDHYFNKTVNYAKLVIIRLFGDKGTWSYGLEKLEIWKKKQGRILLILSGTENEDLSLNEISSINTNESIKISKLLRAGGIENYSKFINYLELLHESKTITPNLLDKKTYADPYLYDWRNEKGPKVAIISYKSLFLANDLNINISLNKKLRKKGFSPKTLFVSTLKNVDIQNEICKMLKNNNICLALTTTSFNSSVENYSTDNYQDENLFSKLNIPVLQILSSTRSHKEWSESSIGMSSIDLLMQIIIPEFDGRITTRPCSFKEVVNIDKKLCTEITNQKINNTAIDWLINLVSNYIRLSKTPNSKKKICLVVSNYPVKNGRIGNGVGLNTLLSTIKILSWLEEEGYYIGTNGIPRSTKELVSLLMNSRTNSLDSNLKKPLDFICLDDYLNYWNTLPSILKQKIIERWDVPQKACDLEKEGFAINGINFGNISLLIQPHRGYDAESNKDIHSPDLPAPHRYLAQYHWISKKFQAHAICHIGKHGSLEWLPGKSVGLSKNCFPHIICPSLPVIYPFIVNDPGEGSQAKRRTHSTIIDHLTPPLDRSDLYGDLSSLEQLIDEYYEARILNSERVHILEKAIRNYADKDFSQIIDSTKENLIEQLDSYICEIKESQIRVGLHTFGTKNNVSDEINLVLCIARVPTEKREGIIGYISNYLKLDINSWTSNYDKNLSKNDIKILNRFSRKKTFSYRKAIDFLEDQAKFLIYYKFYKKNQIIKEIEELKNEKFFNEFLPNLDDHYFNLILNEIYLPIKQSYKKEKSNFISALNAQYVPSGASGAPTRGKIEVLPTGKNFYSVDTRGLPTESAWYVGQESANQILDLYKQDKGEDLKKLAISIWATSTMRNGGEDICQILSLMGIKPVWDGPSRRVVDLDVIPINVLSRPRVDVTIRISGMFRDAFPQLIKLIHKAIKLISNLKEDFNNNPLAELKESNQSIYRIFGSAPNSYGAGLQELISYSNWNDTDDLAKAYINWSSWIYDENGEPIYGKKELENVLKNIQVVMHNQDNREHDILDSDDYYQFQGGLTASIKSLKGKYPEIYHGDLSKYGKSKITNLKREIDKVIRSRVTNPKWIKGMKLNGYKGAFEFSATLDYLYGYDATTNTVSNKSYEYIYNSWLKDPKIIEFFQQNNPWALKDVSQRFLEIINRKMWSNPEKGIVDSLKKLINETESTIEKNNY